MVRAGTAKKRRRNNKVARKGPVHRAIKISCGVPQEVRDAYDKNKSPADNLASFGLDSDPNHFNRRSQSVPGGNGDKKNAAFMGFAVIPESDDLTEKNPRRRKMSEFDQKYVVNCIKKYGENYKKMERDIELNSQQHTEAKMKNICTKYLSLADHERLVHI